MTPTIDEEDWLALVQAGYVGLEKPKVHRSYEKEESRWEGSDNCPEDPEQAAWDELTD